MKETRFPNIYEEQGVLYTRSPVEPNRFAELKIIKQPDGWYREWDPQRSKLAAAIKKGLHRLGLAPGSTVLYLGASHGYTPSHVADIVGEQGFVLCLDFAPRVVRDLVFVCEGRENMAPLLADANRPEQYSERIRELLPVDIVYQDIAQRDQIGIFLKNCDAFLKPGGYGLLAVKARSVDVTKRPAELFKELKKVFDAHPQYNLMDYRELAPYEKDHAFFVVKRR